MSTDGSGLSLTLPWEQPALDSTTSKLINDVLLDVIVPSFRDAGAFDKSLDLGEKSEAIRKLEKLFMQIAPRHFKVDENKWRQYLIYKSWKNTSALVLDILKHPSPQEVPTLLVLSHYVMLKLVWDPIWFCFEGRFLNRNYPKRYPNDDWFDVLEDPVYLRDAEKILLKKCCQTWYGLIHILLNSHDESNIIQLYNIWRDPETSKMLQCGYQLIKSLKNGERKCDPLRYLTLYAKEHKDELLHEFAIILAKRHLFDKQY